MNIMRSKKLLIESRCAKTASMASAWQHPALSRPARKQSGSALIISMIILILLMLLGVAAVTTSDTQFKLAGNLQFDDAALNNAETAIAAAEATLADGVTYQDPGLLIARNAAVTPQFYPMAVLGAQAAPNNDPLTMAWNDTNSTSIAGNSSQRFLIETMSLNDRLIGSTQCTGCRLSSGCNQVNTYRITARGASMRGATKFVQSFYSVLSCPA
jgi:Tfp pilus assembly protein PilX